MPTNRTIGTCLALLGAAIAALLPVFIVLYPASGIGQADLGKPDVVLPVLARTPALFVGPGLVELLGHAVGAAGVVGLWMRWGMRSFLFTCATLGALVWMAVDTIDNAIGLQVVPALAASFASGDAGAGAAYVTLSQLLDALRLAGHFAGGLGIAGISAFALRTGSANRLIAWAGVAVGVVLAANPIVPALLEVSFMTLPAWLIVFGIAVARSDGRREAAFNPGLAMG